MATNKLRKRLEEADEKTLSRMTENFCMIGTPLPRLYGKRDANEYKPVWEQEVRDEQGRRRFHGAFTGGFSAGYYNSVGSKEGWTPSTFRSSRKDKEKIIGEGSSAARGTVGQRPEDFMDEEDLEALKEARGPLGSTQTYQMDDIQQEQIERDPLMAMLGAAPKQRQDNAVASIQVAPTSLGVRLLQRMGWRPGQGLGPRVTFAKRLKLLAMLGMPLSAEDKNDEEASKHLWPPPDTPMPAFSTKNDSKGLGWAGESHRGGLGEALKKARAEDERKRKPGEKTGGFGLGALEVDSDGEDDVYASGTLIEDSTLNKRPAMLWNDDNDRVMLGKAKVKSKESQSDRVTSIDRNCWHDGRPMLAGFRIASAATLEEEPWFEAPEIPKGWAPNPQLLWTQSSAQDNKYKNNMTSSDRASILGEARLPGPPPSILNYLSQKDKERLENSKKAAATILAAKASGVVPAYDKDDKVVDTKEIPKLDVEVARSALQGYMPFTSEPEKQARYRRYLESQVDLEYDKRSLLRPSPSQSQSQFIGELREFAKSASIFKPMSTVMASRFQSSNSGSGDLPQINPGLYIPERKPVLSFDEEKAKAEKQKEEDEKKKLEEMSNLTSFQRNARLGLFGKETTREVKVWKPTRLLCKRFNVPQPYPEDDRIATDDIKEGRDDGKDELEAAFGASKIQQMNLPKINARWEESKKQLQQLASMRGNEHDEVGIEREESEKTEAAKGKMQVGHIDIGNIGLGELKADQDDDKDEKPSIDIFKAVFADDDDDSDSDDDEDENKDKERAMTAAIQSDNHEAKMLKGMPKGNGNIAKGESKEPAASIEDTGKLVFIPRKRNAEEVALKRNGSEEKKKKKNKVKSLLTFSMEEEEGEGEDEEGQQKKLHKDTPSRGHNRPKAADLFN